VHRPPQADARLAQNEFAARLLEGRIGTAPAIRAPQPGITILNSLDTVRQAMLEAVRSAERLISVLTMEMEPAIFDQPAFLEAAKRFVLGRAFGKARLLVRDTTKMNATYNRFVSMAQRLSGSLEIRLLHTDCAALEGTYLIADQHSVVYRERADSYRGIYSRGNPTVVQQRLLDFDAAWVASDNPMVRVSNI
jgi:hypothetical protein